MWRKGKGEDEINGDWIGDPAETQAQDQRHSVKRQKVNKLREPMKKLKSRRSKKIIKVKVKDELLLFFFSNGITWRGNIGNLGVLERKTALGKLFTDLPGWLFWIGDPILLCYISILWTIRDYFLHIPLLSYSPYFGSL